MQYHALHFNALYLSVLCNEIIFYKKITKKI